MTTSVRDLSLVLLAVGLTLGACKKDDEEAPSTPSGGGSTPNTTASTTPSFVGAVGTLWGVNTYSTVSTPIGPIDIEAGLGVAVFPNADNTAYVSAGNITLNGTAVTEQSNHTYVTSPTATNPTGIDFSDGTTHWVVAGSGSVPAFDRTPSFSFPVVAPITSATTVTKSEGYTLTTTSVTGADSVIFTLGGVLKTKVGGTTSCNFTAAEISGLSNGASIVQIAAYNYSHEVIGGKDIYFGKESVRTQSVTIQ